jgi:molecular chaperone DnaJ
MERKTYYKVLGVSSNESDSGIRAAYRDLVKRLHPDVAGEVATDSFREVSEAYGVLSDPQRRRAYNQELSSAQSRVGTSVPRPASAPVARESVPTLGSRDGTRAAVEAIYERFLRPLTGLRGTRSGRLAGLEVEVVLTREEASRGCVVPVDVPVFSCCPGCGGSGGNGAVVCAYCERRGVIEHEGRLRVWLPPLAQRGAVYEISLRGLGMGDFKLRLHVVVEGRHRW